MTTAQGLLIFHPWRQSLTLWFVIRPSIVFSKYLFRIFNIVEATLREPIDAGCLDVCFAFSHLCALALCGPVEAGGLERDFRLAGQGILRTLVS